MSERSSPLRSTDLDSDPLAQFGRWYADAEAAQVPQPEAIALATARPRPPRRCAWCC